MYNSPFAAGVRGSLFLGGYSSLNLFPLVDNITVMPNDFVYCQSTGELWMATVNAWSVVGKIKGEDGANGQQGIQGNQGTQGNAGSITAGSVTTLSPGSSATVTNSGTSSSAVFNFGIPAGNNGTNGSNGQTGAAGSRGSLFFGGYSSVGNLPTIDGINVKANDFALITSTSDLYVAGSSSWSLVGNIKGSQGNAGTNGTNGTNGIQGIQGNPGTAATVSIGTITTGSAGSYASVTNSGTTSAAVLNFTIPQGLTGATGSPPTKTFSSTTRSTNTVFQISSTQDAFVEYSIDIGTSFSLTSGATGTIYLRYADNSGFTTNVKEVCRAVNGNTGTLTVGLNLSQLSTGRLSGWIPAGKFVEIVTENTVGTPSFTFRSGQEVLF
jgi:hypothetical protein